MALKLNLGCGLNPMKGFVGVDKHGSPEVKCDLEVFPWPWPSDSVDEVLLYHSLEHMGERTDTFIGIMKELYRVCAHGATVHIAVPHPRHDSFIDDPTHVRIITSGVLACFCRKFNLQAQKEGAPNSPLAIYHDVNFEIAGITYGLDEPYATQHREGKLGTQELETLMKKCNNVASEIRMDLKVIKGAP